jgi:uncharacterized membrane protein YphA (DoxX/SURF4 family)
MRLVGGTAFAAHALSTGHAGAAPLAAAVLSVTAGLFLVIGLWTPIAGVLVAAIEIWLALTGTEDPLVGMLLATLGAGLALVGPGAWSIDARLFGWKRIHVRDRTR